MRVAVISDVHGNRVALDAVLSDMPEVDGIVCAGDVVGYNPWPAECVAELRERGVPTVMGNHDRAVASGTAFRFNGMAAAGVEYTREVLDDDAMAWLSDLPDERTEFAASFRLVSLTLSSSPNLPVSSIPLPVRPPSRDALDALQHEQLGVGRRSVVSPPRRAPSSTLAGRYRPSYSRVPMRSGNPASFTASTTASIS